ncbi:hypothetical protein F4808DRAFT_455944 [Astrocystis sublimbata]|nr:hypothetical protein F4808DRAFT_455944 [Astrocystis sublimbata]
MSKIIITGATGFLGRAVVQEAIGSSSVTHAFILTRSPLPSHISQHSKVTVIEHDDFMSYPPDVLKKLLGCESCIWCIGGQDSKFPDTATAKQVLVDYPVYAAATFAVELAPYCQGNFRFVYLSGRYAEWNQDRTLFFSAKTRYMRGLAEQKLLELATINRKRLRVNVVRAGGLLRANPAMKCRPMTSTDDDQPLVKEPGSKVAHVESWVKEKLGLIAVDRLAWMLLKVAAEGGQSIIEMEQLRPTQDRL